MFTHSMTEQRQVVGRNPKLITERLFPDDTISRYQQGTYGRFFGPAIPPAPNSCGIASTVFQQPKHKTI